MNDTDELFPGPGPGSEGSDSVLLQVAVYRDGKKCGGRIAVLKDSDDIAKVLHMLAGRVLKEV